MATMLPAQVSALQVGSYFVGQYYILLQQDPSLVHKFYSDASTMNRFDGVRAESAAGMMQIHNLITQLHYTGINIKSAQPLESWNGGILVMVSGSIQIKEHSSWRKFAQTFFLAPQAIGYFVLNDIFHFIDDEQAHQHPYASYESTIAAHNPITATVADDHTLGHGTQTRNNVYPVSMEQTNTVDKYSIHDPTQKFLQPALNLGTTTIDIARDPPLTPLGLAKHTYASILRVAKAQSGKPSPHNAPPNKVNKKPSYIPKNSNAEVVDSADVKDEGKLKSVYVGNVPPSITTSQLEKEFKKFGELRSDGIAIKTRKEDGAFYAFIEFDDATGVKNAIEASPVEVSGWQVYVEARRPNNSSYRGGRRGRGRGRQQYDAPRGHFGNRSYDKREYENNKRDHKSHPNGSGYHRKVSSQENGISAEQEQTE